MQAEIINNIKFGIFSPEQIKKLSVAKLTVPDTYNEDGYPIDGGLLDQRLGVIDPGLVCKTCGGRNKNCPGHFGHIELVRPAIHSEFGKIINMLLQATCQKCHRILLNNDQIASFKSEIDAELTTESGAKENSADSHSEAALLKKVKSIKKCPHCEAVQEKLKYSMPTYFYMGERRLKPDEIRDMLMKISDSDLLLLGIDPRTSRPEGLILDTLLVPPVGVRPSITLETGERSEDDLTHKLVDIMRINQRLEQNINAGAPQIIIDDLWELLQYHVTTYFNNETSGIPPARHRSGRALKTIAQRLKGKEGRFRYNLSGKRVNYSARTVISVDPFIDIDEVGIPRSIAEKMTVPFYVTEWNFEAAKALLERTEYPVVVNVIMPDGKRKRILETNKEDLVKELKAGYILERQLQDGDITLFNRQPSLHRISIMAHRARIMGGKTFRINYCSTTPYNADFDGDEMNLHIPQTLEAQAEARYLMLVAEQIFSPKNGDAVITNGEDGVVGFHLLTQDDALLTKDEVAYLLGIAGVREMPKEAKGGMYRGKDVFSLLLPKGLNYELTTKKEHFVIKNGQLIEGTVTKAIFGQGNTMFVKIVSDFGFEALRKFLSNASRVADACATFYGVSIGVKDYLTSEEVTRQKEKLIADTDTKVHDLIISYKNGKLEPLLGYTLRQSLERMITAELDMARESAGNMLASHTDKKNSAMLMSISGKGNIVQFAQMSMFLGQQAPMSGGRIKRGYYTKRVVPHVEPKSILPRARGFVTSNFSAGLTPVEMMMHAIGARSSVIHKGLLTPKSGYLQRRLANAMQDYCVYSDGSVRDVSNNIIQTVYGGDGVEPTRVRFAKTELGEGD
ncbi:DNA-directed RNA polymerase subunit A' [uncultured archaeon]|nr:DNA-directed RNA polymerase subunit A' [uncultured archaeon]